MSEIEKTYYKSNKKFKLFGLKFFEIEYDSKCLDGKGEFIQTSIPNKEYFEKEFRMRRKEK